MYSTVQLQCLKQLGIPFVKLNAQYTAQNNVAEETAVEKSVKSDVINSQLWQTIPLEMMADIKVLFPQLQLDELGARLTNQYSWSLADVTDITLNENQLVSPLPNALSSIQKRQLWQHLSSFINE